jgi:hypothetical protein
MQISRNRLSLRLAVSFPKFGDGRLPKRQSFSAFYSIATKQQSQEGIFGKIEKAADFSATSPYAVHH